MGYSSYTADAAVKLRTTADSRKSKSADDIFIAPVGRSVSVHEVPKEVNPLGVVARESRDSEDHPNSKGIVVGFDTTASMGHFPKVFALEALPDLMSLLVQKDFCEDPQVLFAAFNDGTTGAHALQVGQFESGIEIDDDLVRLPLQGGGGGTMEESSEMLIYWAARHTVMDCMEKRGEKGYLFILTDEKPYPTVNAQMVKRTIGDDLQGDMKTEEALAEAQKSFEVFCIFAKTYDPARGSMIRARWVDLLGAENVIDLQDAKGVAETIAVTVGIHEGALHHATLAADLANAGIDATRVSNVAAAVSNVTSSKVAPVSAPV